MHNYENNYKKIFCENVSGINEKDLDVNVEKNQNFIKLNSFNIKEDKQENKIINNINSNHMRSYNNYLNKYKENNDADNNKFLINNCNLINNYETSNINSSSSKEVSNCNDIIYKKEQNFYSHIKNIHTNNDNEINNKEKHNINYDKDKTKNDKFYINYEKSNKGNLNMENKNEYNTNSNINVLNMNSCNDKNISLENYSNVFVTCNTNNSNNNSKHLKINYENCINEKENINLYKLNNRGITYFEKNISQVSDISNEQFNTNNNNISHRINNENFNDHYYNNHLNIRKNNLYKSNDIIKDRIFVDNAKSESRNNKKYINVNNDNSYNIIYDNENKALVNYYIDSNKVNSLIDKNMNTVSNNLVNIKEKDKYLINSYNTNETDKDNNNVITLKKNDTNHLFNLNNNYTEYDFNNNNYYSICEDNKNILIDKFNGNNYYNIEKNEFSLIKESNKMDVNKSNYNVYDYSNCENKNQLNCKRDYISSENLHNLKNIEIENRGLNEKEIRNNDEDNSCLNIDKNNFNEECKKKSTINRNNQIDRNHNILEGNNGYSKKEINSFNINSNENKITMMNNNNIAFFYDKIGNNIDNNIKINENFKNSNYDNKSFYNKNNKNFLTEDHTINNVLNENNTHLDNLKDLKNIHNFSDYLNMKKSDDLFNFNDNSDIINTFVIKYLSDIDKIYEIKEKNKKNDNNINSYYNILELLYNACKKKKKLKDKRIRALLYVFKYIKKKEKEKKRNMYLFDIVTLKRLNKQVDLYIEFVKKREYKKDLCLHLHKKNKMNDGITNCKNFSYSQTKFIQNILNKKSNLFIKSQNQPQVNNNHFYFNHTLKKVTYINNLLVYIHFIILKYISIFSINQWNKLLFQDIDNYNDQKNKTFIKNYINYKDNKMSFHETFVFVNKLNTNQNFEMMKNNFNEKYKFPNIEKNEVIHKNENKNETQQTSEKINEQELEEKGNSKNYNYIDNLNKKVYIGLKNEKNDNFFHDSNINSNTKNKEDNFCINNLNKSSEKEMDIISFKFDNKNVMNNNNDPSHNGNKDSNYYINLNNNSSNTINYDNVNNNSNNNNNYDNINNNSNNNNNYDNINNNSNNNNNYDNINNNNNNNNNYDNINNNSNNNNNYDNINNNSSNNNNNYDNINNNSNNNNNINNSDNIKNNSNQNNYSDNLNKDSNNENNHNSNYDNIKNNSNQNNYIDNLNNNSNSEKNQNINDDNNNNNYDDNLNNNSNNNNNNNNEIGNSNNNFNIPLANNSTYNINKNDKNITNINCYLNNKNNNDLYTYNNTFNEINNYENKYQELNNEIIEKLNPLNINNENIIDINYYEYVIEPFDFFFYDQIYNEIYNYLQMLKNNNSYSNNTYMNCEENLIKNLPYHHYEFIEILMKEIMNVRDLIYRNKYVRYLFYYIYKNDKNNLVESINKILSLEKKKVLLYKIQMKLRYNIFISRFFENNYIIINNTEDKEQEGINFNEAKSKLFNTFYNKYSDYYNEYKDKTNQMRERKKKLFNICEEKFGEIKKKLNMYSDYFNNVRRKLEIKTYIYEVNKKEEISVKKELEKNKIQEEITKEEIEKVDKENIEMKKDVEEGIQKEEKKKEINKNEVIKENTLNDRIEKIVDCLENVQDNEYEKEKLNFSVPYNYVEFLYDKNYTIIINSEKSNSRKFKASYIINSNLKGNENLLIITSILNTVTWKKLFFSFKNITVYKNEESIIENKISDLYSNLIICIDFLPKILHVTCDIILLDLCHFNLLNQINILNDLSLLNVKKKILILNCLSDNWNFLSSLFFLNNHISNNSLINSTFQLNHSEEDKKILSNLMLEFISNFCITNQQNSLLERKNRKCFILTYMSGIQKFIYDNVDDKNKILACVHPLLMLNEKNFFLKDFNISEKFELLKNIIKKFCVLKKKILICYSGEKLVILIQILLYLYSLHNSSNILLFNHEINKDINLDNYDVAIIVNNHTEFLEYFKHEKLSCYFLVSTYTKEEDSLLENFKNSKELYFFKKKKEEFINAKKKNRELLYRYYINNLISENDEQFILFSIIDQKEKIYSHTSYNEIVLPTCFSTILSNCDNVSQYTEYWKDIKNAHNFWDLNILNKEKIKFYLDKKKMIYDKYQNIISPISEEYLPPPQIHYYLNNSMNEKTTFNFCISIALDEIIQELSRKKEKDDFDEIKKNILLNIKEKSSKNYFSSLRKMEKILCKFLEENKKKSFEQFLKCCESYSQIIMKCTEKLFFTFNKSYNNHFKNFEDFWCDEEEKRKEKWKEIWELNEKNENDKEKNNIYNMCVEKNELCDNYNNDDGFDKLKNEFNLKEKKNFRIRLSSQLFEDNELNQLFINGKKIRTSLNEKKEKDKKTCLYIERKEEQEIENY
ncbi:conserved Plasmodium protein, unknown function [Plasmodium gallinaceum]|uniref:Uncharacterized protein n=1 Tax=Plasmodium gallinaceum TaxID=5849 RepID=A0A1J1GV40_PLAGA|nr:conserved Plasmodium protein, unknown function [Plasmodium gallinaceum]CRG96330.1 conserved Plasmodium protein, unknown function [Plasmodium gallinaceum]